jgi:hypothetical protein
MSIQTAYSSNQSVKEAVIEISKQINIQNPRLVLFFSSSRYQNAEVASEVKKAFEVADVLGCSTAGEIVTGKMLNESIVVMAFDKESVADIKIEVLENLKGNADPKSVLDSFEKYYGEKVADMDFGKYLGLVLVDGLSNSEEKLMENLGARTNVYFVGGSAGDDLKFTETNLFANGKSYTNAAVLALLKPGVPFEIVKTQSFDVMKNHFIATKVDEQNREVVELDNKPAMEVYAESLATTVEKAASEFMTYPFGVMIGEEPFVRSPQQATGGGIKFYCNIAESTELTLLRSTDIVKETREIVEEKLKEHAKISGLINFNCILRTLELQNKKQTEAYGKIFENIQTIGFSTYGEEYIGHINQTAVMVLFL